MRAVSVPRASRANRPIAQPVQGPSHAGDLVNRKRILLADDHKEFLFSIRDMLSPRYDIVGIVRDGEALITAARATMPDLIISDLRMPGMNGLKAAARLLEERSTDIIFLTIESSPSYARKALSVGARGYVLKTYAAEQLPTAILEVLAGRQFISPQIPFAIPALNVAPA